MQIPNIIIQFLHRIVLMHYFQDSKQSVQLVPEGVQYKEPLRFDVKLKVALKEQQNNVIKVRDFARGLQVIYYLTFSINQRLAILIS